MFLQGFGPAFAKMLLTISLFLAGGLGSGAAFVSIRGEHDRLPIRTFSLEIGSNGTLCDYEGNEIAEKSWNKLLRPEDDSTQLHPPCYLSIFVRKIDLQSLINLHSIVAKLKRISDPKRITIIYINFHSLRQKN